MINNRHNFKNTPKNEQKDALTTSDKNSSFLCSDNLTNIFPKQTEAKVEEVNNIINQIRESSPISIWDLCKKVNVSHSKLYYIIRDLEFAGVVYTKIMLNENNRSSRMIYIKEEKEK